MDKFEKEIEMAKPDDSLDGQFVNRVMDSIEPLPVSNRRWKIILPISIGSGVVIALAGFLILSGIRTTNPISSETANIVARTPAQIIEAIDVQTTEVTSDLEKDIDSELDITQFDDIVY